MSLLHNNSSLAHLLIMSKLVHSTAFTIDVFAITTQINLNLKPNPMSFSSTPSLKVSISSRGNKFLIVGLPQ
ncbi:hypothetical protein KFK09_002721 [Dendrobium nobile]|uniref:Uncharacterized protein n=1 Tax=Dendrobium nobile TaxID=94219 RepID=A0A8T3C814_DENNO|nr:hypothetical protein KFK09_002721 [Dendrobium nobile]